MTISDFGVYEDGLTIDCTALRKIEPSAEELEKLSSDEFKVRVVPSDVGGYVPPDIVLWVAESILIPLAVNAIYDLLKKKLPPIIQFLKEKQKSRQNELGEHSDEHQADFHLAFKGSHASFVVDLPDDMDEEKFDEILKLFAEMVKAATKQK